MRQEEKKKEGGTERRKKRQKGIRQEIRKIWLKEVRKEEARQGKEENYRNGVRQKKARKTGRMKWFNDNRIIITTTTVKAKK